MKAPSEEEEEGENSSSEEEEEGGGSPAYMRAHRRDLGPGDSIGSFCFIRAILFMKNEKFNS